MNSRLSVLAAVPILLGLSHGLTKAADPFRSDVFVSGRQGYHTYRIPALIVSSKGTLLAFCEGRKTSRADHGDLDLVLRRSKDRGKTWQATQLVYEEGGAKKITIGNPCPVLDRDTGRIWLPFTRNNDDVFITSSGDDGKTWTKPRRITKSVKKSDWGWYATGPGVGIQLRRGRYKGRLVIPCDHRASGERRGTTHSHVFFSDNHGKTWKLGGTVASHTNECQVVELADGTLMINMRNYWGRDGKQKDKDRMRAVAVSRDGGETWGKLRFDSTLIESICQASLIRDTTARGDRLLFSNPASKTTRHRLTVRLSRDGGNTWPVAKLLHAGPAAYSCLTVLPDGSIGCLYEGGKKHAHEKILFARFTMNWLTKEKQTLDIKPKIVMVRKIWDRAAHNAFTDLVRFRGKWYCTFREGERHAGGRNGKIRVIVSDTGDRWESAALLSEQSVDLRDPKLSVTPKGRLMMVAGGSIYRKAEYLTRAPRVAFSKDGRAWSKITKVLAEDHWLWRVTWHKGRAYSVSKLGTGRDPRRVMLYASRDGLHWKWITEFKNIPAWPNEATIRFLEKDEMMVLLRRNKTTWIGTSRPPYTKWTWHDTGHRTGGPNFISVPGGGLWAAARRYKKDGKPKTVLARMTRSSYTPILELPSGGDTSYPGMVWHKGLLWMSYYSSHEGRASIYLARIRLNSPRAKKFRRTNR